MLGLKLISSKLFCVWVPLVDVAEAFKVRGNSYFDYMHPPLLLEIASTVLHFRSATPRHPPHTL